MNMKLAIVAMMTVTLASPVWAGAHSNKFVSATLTSCQKMVKAKHLAKDEAKGEVDKCMDNPSAYK
jgi:hypothetical protein